MLALTFLHFYWKAPPVGCIFLAFFLNFFCNFLAGTVTQSLVFRPRRHDSTIGVLAVDVHCRSQCSRTLWRWLWNSGHCLLAHCAQWKKLRRATAVWHRPACNTGQVSAWRSPTTKENERRPPGLTDDDNNVTKTARGYMAKEKPPPVKKKTDLLNDWEKLGAGKFHSIKPRSNLGKQIEQKEKRKRRKETEKQLRWAHRRCAPTRRQVHKEIIQWKRQLCRKATQFLTKKAVSVFSVNCGVTKHVKKAGRTNLVYRTPRWIRTSMIHCNCFELLTFNTIASKYLTLWISRKTRRLTQHKYVFFSGGSSSSFIGR